MNCLEIQNQLTTSSSFSKLSRSVQKHVEACTDCQGAYAAKPTLRALLIEALPEIEPDRRLVAAMRQKMDQEMSKRSWGWGFLSFDLSSLSFAGGVAALFVVLGLPVLWMGAQQNAAAPQTSTIASAERMPVPSELAGPFSGSDPLLVSDPLTSLNQAYRPQIRPGAVVHVIYPFKAEKQAQRSVVHY
jgi:hypothetical protein